MKLIKKCRLIAVILAIGLLTSAITLPKNSTQAEIPEELSDAEIISASSSGSVFVEKLETNYNDPDREYSTEARFWLAEGSHTEETLKEEIDNLYNMGFRGFEVCQLNESSLDATVWGYGSEQWDNDLKFILNYALDLGMTVSLTSGTNWATANIPGLDPDSNAASQEVGYSYEFVDSGQTRSGALEEAGKRNIAPDNIKRTLIGVYAYRYDLEAVEDVAYTWAGKNEWIRDAIQVHEGSVIDLTADVVNDTLTWTAPSDGNYVLCAFWQQGAYQIASPAVEDSYCINYFDTKGLEALKAYWRENVLDDPALVEKVRNGDVQLFMDSLEISTSQGDKFFWSEEMADEFLERKGYDIRPYLYLFIGQPNLWHVDPPPLDYGTFDIKDEAELRKSIRNDLHDVHTQLYMEYMMTPFKEWLNTEYNIKLRAQISYGQYLEISEPIQVVDYPEAETLNHRDQVDFYRLWSGGSHLQNKVMSSETGALNGYRYGYTMQQILQQTYVQYAAGYSRIIWHGWASQYGPASNTNWPGYEAGLPTHYKWGTREPASSEYDEFNNHLGRVQQLLREGTSGTDIGMLFQRYDQPTMTFGRGDWMQTHQTVFFPSTVLQDNGYTYDYFSPAFLTADDVYFDKETLTLELAGYKAIVVWQEWLSLDGAKALLDLAQDGLKVVVVDGAAVRTPYNDENNSQLQDVMTQLKTLDTVKSVENADATYTALQELGVNPYAEFEEENRQLLTQVRRDGDDRYLYVYNYCSDEYCTEDHGTNIQTEIIMDGYFIPYYIDAWTGEVSQIAQFRYEDGKTIFSVDIDYGDVKLYAFEAIDETAEKLHVISSNADVISEGGRFVTRATESGNYETVLSDGSTYQQTIEVPEAYEITDWDVVVESWNKGEWTERTETVNNVTTVEGTYMTAKTEIPVTLSTLTTWDNISDVGKEVSGKGYYSATFTWDGTADGAYLDFGDIDQSMKVYVNGEKTKDVNMNDPIVDISEQLVIGENEIYIVYSSNLTNVQLSRGVIAETENVTDWLGYSLYYHSYGLKSATIVPYVDNAINEATITGSSYLGGTIDAATSVTKGSDAEITVKANNGYKLAAILIDGVTADISSITNDVLTIENVQKDMSLRALFVEEGVDFADQFTDVLKLDVNGDDMWYYEAVNMLTGLEIVEGTTNTTYEPEKDVTRAEVTKLLYELAEALGIEVTTSDSIPFTDMPVENYWAAGYIGWAYENEIVDGYDGVNFGPEDSIRRQDIALMMQRFFEEYIGYDLPGDITITFTDQSSIDPYAANGVEYAVRTGLMEGKDDNTFAPIDSALRSQIAQIFYNYLIFTE